DDLPLVASAPRGPTMGRACPHGDARHRSGSGTARRTGRATGRRRQQRLPLSRRSFARSEPARGVGAVDATRRPALRPTGGYQRARFEAGAVRLALGGSAPVAPRRALLAARGEEQARTRAVSPIVLR